jgi:hypothetical protein
MLQQPKSTEISKGSTVGKTKITNLILSNFLFSYVFLGSPRCNHHVLRTRRMVKIWISMCGESEHRVKMTQRNKNLMVWKEGRDVADGEKCR